MRKFEYVQPTSVDEATRFLAANADDALVIGGGTAAVVLLEMGMLRPKYVVDIGRIAALKAAPAVNGAGMRMGALTTIRTLERAPAVREAFAPLQEAASQVGNVRVRNFATVGGSIKPSVELNPLAGQLRLTEASGSLVANRTDVHKVRIVIAQKLDQLDDQLGAGGGGGKKGRGAEIKERIYQELYQQRPQEFKLIQ